LAHKYSNICATGQPSGAKMRESRSLTAAAEAVPTALSLPFPSLTFPVFSAMPGFATAIRPWLNCRALWHRRGLPLPLPLPRWLPSSAADKLALFRERPRLPAVHPSTHSPIHSIHSLSHSIPKSGQHMQQQQQQPSSRRAEDNSVAAA
jgi:hypothetical protein